MAAPRPTPPPRPVLAAAAWAVLLVGVVATRPDDGALLQSAGVGGDWVEHRDLLRFLLRGEELGWRSAWVQADERYPPLTKVVTGVLAGLAGSSATSLLRLHLLYAVGLAACAAGIAGRVGGRAAGLAAGVVALGVPATLASSYVVHNDLLQVLLLWCGVWALAAHQDRRFVIGGLLAGLAFAAACLTKWSAPFFGVPLAASALLLSPGRGERPRLGPRAASMGLALAVAAGAVDAALRVSSTSFRAMLELSYRVQAAPVSDLPSAIQAGITALGSVHRAPRPPTEAFEYTYLPFRFLASTTSPLLAGLLAVALAAWAWRSRRAAALPLLAVPALWVVCVLLMEKPDDRWLIAMVPAYAVAAGLGWAALGRRTQAVLAVAWCGASLWVAWDFHHAERDHPHTLAVADHFGLPDHFSWAGLGADSTQDTTYGWSRLDAGGLPPFLPHKDAFWDAAMACQPSSVRVEDPGVQEYSDDTWWDYRNLRRALHEDAELLDITTVDGQRYSGESRRGRAVAIVAADRTDRPAIADLLPGYTLVATIPAPEGPYAPVAVYADGPCP